jgi:hypothetical protein
METVCSSVPESPAAFPVSDPFEDVEALNGFGAATRLTCRGAPSSAAMIRKPMTP